MSVFVELPMFSLWSNQSSQHLSVSHNDDPQQGQNSCLWRFHLLFEMTNDWEVITGAWSIEWSDCGTVWLPSDVDCSALFQCSSLVRGMPLPVISQHVPPNSVPLCKFPLHQAHKLEPQPFHFQDSIYWEGEASPPNTQASPPPKKNFFFQLQCKIMAVSKLLLASKRWQIDVLG